MTGPICQLMLTDPSHDSEQAAVIAALRSATDHNGILDPNNARPLIPCWVSPRVVSATYNTLIRRHELIPAGWTTNQDRKGRNSGKPQRFYRWGQT